MPSSENDLNWAFTLRLQSSYPIIFNPLNINIKMLFFIFVHHWDSSFQHLHKHTFYLKKKHCCLLSVVCELIRKYSFVKLLQMALVEFHSHRDGVINALQYEYYCSISIFIHRDRRNSTNSIK